MLQNVGKVSGMVDVAIVHGRILYALEAAAQAGPRKMKRAISVTRNRPFETKSKLPQRLTI
jgi:hypothetical protein